MRIVLVYAEHPSFSDGFPLEKRMTVFIGVMFGFVLGCLLKEKVKGLFAKVKNLI